MQTARFAPKFFRWFTKTNNTTPKTAERTAVSLQLQAEKLSNFSGSRTRSIDQAFQSMRLNLRCK